MESSHPVAPAGGAECERRHAEVLIGGAGLNAGEVELSEVGFHVAIDERGVEGFVPLGDGCVGGEAAGVADVSDGLGEGLVVVLDAFSGAFEGEEGGMAFVEMAYADLYVERAKQTPTTDAEEDLLADALVAVGGVKTMNHAAMAWGVSEQVGVELIKRDAPDVESPRSALHPVAGEVDPDAERPLRVVTSRAGVSAMRRRGYAFRCKPVRSVHCRV